MSRDDVKGNQKRRYRISLVILLTVLATLSGCGTAHYYLPPRPLAEGQWQLSISWHYDLSSLTPQSSIIIPEVNGYMGLAHSAVVGSGYTFPGFISHISVAQYYREVSDNYWIAWLHHRVDAPHDNPFIEIGGAYSARRDGISQMISLGLGIGQFSSWGNMLTPGRMSPRLVAKYGISGSDFAMDLVNYHGNAANQIREIFPVWPPYHDTLWTFLASEVVSVTESQDDTSLHGRSDRSITLLLRSGDTFDLTGPRRYVDNWRPVDHYIDDWVCKNLQFVYVGGEWAIIDVEALRKDIGQGRTVVITRAPKSFVDQVNAFDNWVRDTSIGWAVFAWPR